MASRREMKKVLIEAGDAARRIQLRHFGKLDRIDKKGAIDLLTIADRNSEKAVIDRIHAAFPDHAILAEESGASERADDAEFRWVIDPLDGTTNYAHGVPVFAVSIALQQKGQTIMGLVIDPTRDEWFFAERGKGATLNRRRIGVSPTPKLADALVATGFPYARRQDPTHFTRLIEGFLMESRGVLRLGAAALDLCWVAAGRLDGFWEEILHPWDVAAGSLIILEAGGRVSKFNGRAPGIFDEEILCSNGHIHREMIRCIRKYWTDWHR